MVASIHTEKVFDRSLIFFYDKRPEKSSGYGLSQPDRAALVSFSAALISTMTKKWHGEYAVHDSSYSRLVRKSVQEPKQILWRTAALWQSFLYTQTHRPSP